jgi:hypothetical protein
VASKTSEQVLAWLKCNGGLMAQASLILVVGVALRAHVGAAARPEPGLFALTSQQSAGQRLPGELVAGGRSPDNRFQLRIVQTNKRDPSNYVLTIVETPSGRAVKELAQSGGAFQFGDATKIVKALWHSGGRVVAFTDAGTQHSRELYLYEVTDSDAVQLKVPDYVQNALGRIGATSIAGVSVTELQGWDGDRLRCMLTFDAVVPLRQGGRSSTFQVPFVLGLSHGAHEKSRIVLENVGRPVARMVPAL